MKLNNVIPALLVGTAIFGTGVHAAQPLQGRNIFGNKVAPNAENAVFEYDPNLNITWLRDWKDSGNFEGTDWNTSMNWASNLTVGTFKDWSLPTINAFDTTCDESFGAGAAFPTQHAGYHCTGSPMGYLYYTELGNPAGGPMSNAGPFLNMRRYYWSGTEYAPDTRLAWSFQTYDGKQAANVDRIYRMYAVAVRPGDLTPDVPEPLPLAMILMGLSAVAMATRSRKR